MQILWLQCLEAIHREPVTMWKICMLFVPMTCMFHVKYSKIFHSLTLIASMNYLVTYLKYTFDGATLFPCHLFFCAGGGSHNSWFSREGWSYLCSRGLKKLSS